jgi:hypothetical protein
MLITRVVRFRIYSLSIVGSLSISSDLCTMNALIQTTFGLELVEVTWLVHYFVLKRRMPHIVLRRLDVSHLSVVLQQGRVVDTFFGMIGCILLKPYKF